MAATPTETSSRSTPSEAPGSSTGGTSSVTSLVCMDSKHAVYRHFKVPADSVGENDTKVCAYCNFKFAGGVYRCAQHITGWNGMCRREVHLCTAAPKTARDTVKALYESRLKAREEKRAAEIAAVGAVNGGGSDKKKSRMSDFYGDDAACANQAADESICLFFAALHLPEHHADHPLWRNVVSSIQRAGQNYIPPKRRYIGGAGLAKCRQRIEAALAPISASWRRDGVTVASDTFSDKAGRPQANVLLINDSGAVFVESIDTKMEMKTGGYIASILRPIVEKVGPENVIALCFDSGSNYAAACRELMTEYPHIEHIPYATHVLDLLMEDIGKMGWAKDIVTRGDTLISFVRNHHFARGYMQSELVNGGKGKQVLKPAGTRFGTNYIAMHAALADREAMKEGKMTAVAWWSWHGTEHPELTTMACHTLTQPVSASPCERNWAKFDAVHTARRNRLGAEKLRDLVYVTHNWQVVHNWHKVPEGQRVVKGNIEDPPTPVGYNVEEELEEPEVGEDDVMADEY
ncbi:unnamed protein product [Closterium sp. NIES-53]